MLRFATILGAAIIALGSITAHAADLVRVSSAHSVADTADRLAAAVDGAGAKLFARIDHAAGAESVGMELAPSITLIFGNPKLGTPAMQASATMGLDLPLRVLVTEMDGETFLVYHAPADVAALHGVPSDHPVVGKMTGALGKLTAKAAAE
ncbi:MAG: DUF302 domain-containing protein [Pseudomonadota bacterium]